MSFVRFSKVCLACSLLLVIASIALLIGIGPKLSIDFVGGSLMELRFEKPVEKAALVTALQSYSGQTSLQNTVVSYTREGTVLLRTPSLSPEEHKAVLSHIGSVGSFAETRFTVIDATVGKTMKHRAIVALVLSSLATIVYIAIAFRKIPSRLSAWRFGVTAVIALLHDIIVTVGIFVVIGLYTGFEMDLLFITALLTIMGYSVNDTIVIFDRIRENLTLQGRKEDFALTAARSVRETLLRSINVSVATLIMLCSLYWLGSESIRWFVLTLIVGTIIGTYSSICLATPILIFWRKRHS